MKGVTEKPSSMAPAPLLKHMKKIVIHESPCPENIGKKDKPSPAKMTSRGPKVKVPLTQKGKRIKGKVVA